MQNGKHNIYTIAPDGSNNQQLTSSSVSEGWHAWSPNGDWIVFDASDQEGSWFDIHLMKADGSQSKN